METLRLVEDRRKDYLSMAVGSATAQSRPNAVLLTLASSIMISHFGFSEA
jgi:hypothetical protein